MIQTIFLLTIHDELFTFNKVYHCLQSACAYGAHYFYDRQDSLQGPEQGRFFLEDELAKTGSLVRQYKDSVGYLSIIVTEHEVY